MSLKVSLNNAVTLRRMVPTSESEELTSTDLLSITSCMIKAQTETWAVSALRAYYSLLQQNKLLTVTPWLQITHPPLQNHFAYIILSKSTVEEQTGSVTGGSAESHISPIPRIYLTPNNPPCLTLSSRPSPHFLLHSEPFEYGSTVSKTLLLLKVW